MQRLLRSSGEVVLLALKESWMVVVEMDGLWWSNHLLVGGAVLSHILVPTDHHPENTNTKPNERRPPGLWNRVNHQDICPEKKTCSSTINSLQKLDQVYCA